MDQIAAIAEGAPAGFSVYSGDDADTLEIMGLGGVGVVSTIANVAPKRMKEIVELEAAGRHDEALAAHAALLPLMNGALRHLEPHHGEGGPQARGLSRGRPASSPHRGDAEQSARLAEVCAPVRP